MPIRSTCGSDLLQRVQPFAGQHDGQRHHQSSRDGEHVPQRQTGTEPEEQPRENERAEERGHDPPADEITAAVTCIDGKCNEKQDRLERFTEDSEEGDHGQTEQPAAREHRGHLLLDECFPSRDLGAPVQPEAHVQQHRDGNQRGDTFEQLALHAAGREQRVGCEPGHRSNENRADPSSVHPECRASRADGTQHGEDGHDDQHCFECFAQHDGDRHREDEPG
jgi:hypothetical protein